jgi:hypothetical protein
MLTDTPAAGQTPAGALIQGHARTKKMHENPGEPADGRDAAPPGGRHAASRPHLSGGPSGLAT